MRILVVLFMSWHIVLAHTNESSCVDILSARSELTAAYVAQYIDCELQNDQGCKDLVGDLLERIYESAPRSIPKADNNMSFGCALPTNAEVTDYLLRNARGKTIVSLGGASGEDLILAALAGAKRVVNNDLSSYEMMFYNSYKSRLPKKIQSNAEDALCSCFALLTLKSDLQQSCDFVLCNNLIHCFNAAEQATFFELVRNLLVPGGQIIVTANAIDNDNFLADPVIGASLLNNPHHTSFSQILHSFYSIEQRSDEVLYHKIFLNNNNFQVGRAYYSILYQDRDAKWVADQTAVNTFMTDLGPEGASAYAEMSKNLIYDSMGNIANGEFYITKSSIMAFLPIALRTLLEKNGFDVDTTFCVNEVGHAIHDLASLDTYDSQILQALPLDNQPCRVGVIARLSGRQASVTLFDEIIKRPSQRASFLDSVHEKLHAICRLFCLP
jgi:SAM-dependent methyltransferase